MVLFSAVLSAALLPSFAEAILLGNPAQSPPSGVRLGLELVSPSRAMKPDDAAFNGFTLGGGHFFLRASAAIPHGPEIWAKTGLGTLSIERAFTDGSDFKGDNTKPAFGFGLGKSLGLPGLWRAGAAVQFVAYGEQRDERIYGGPSGKDVIKLLKPRETTAAMVLSREVDWVSPYGGVVLAWRRVGVVDSGERLYVPFSSSADYRENGLAGALLGVSLRRGRWQGLIEIQAFKETTAGIGLSRSF